jgi:hypothetical protein
MLKEIKLIHSIKVYEGKLIEKFMPEKEKDKGAIKKNERQTDLSAQRTEKFVGIDQR